MSAEAPNSPPAEKKPDESLGLIDKIEEVLDKDIPPVVEIAANVSAAASPSIDDKVPADAPEKENILLNIAINVVIPTVILTQLGKEGRLGPHGALLAGLAFPLAYGIWDLIKRRRWNLFSIIGVASVLLTGGLELFKVTPIWFAVKEGGIPLVLGAVVLLSMRSKRPLVKTLLLNPSVLDLRKVYRALHARGTTAQFERHLDVGSYWLAGSFLLSAALNFILTLWIIKSPAGTEARTAEIGKLTMLSYPVIVIPTMGILFYALYKLINGIKELTGLELDDIFHGEHGKEEKKAA
jgi:hypothetical protein